MAAQISSDHFGRSGDKVQGQNVIVHFMVKVAEGPLINTIHHKCRRTSPKY